jgi:predicted dehydrogenase
MRVGVIGVGGHASNSLHPNLPAAGMDVVAVCARRQERAEAAAVRLGADHAFDDATKMLESVTLDGVVVCVPVGEYARLIRLCVEAGRPVYADKPASANAAVADELALQSATHGVPVVVGYMKRFAPAYQRARDIVQSCGFGSPTLATFSFVLGEWMKGDLRHFLVDAPVHQLDLARYLIGELAEVNAHVTASAAGFAVAAAARSESGAVCTFNFGTTGSWTHRNEYAEIFGHGHSVWIDNVETCVDRPPGEPERRWHPNHTVGLPNNTTPTITGFLPALSHFRAVVMQSAENLSDMASAAKTLALAEQLCDSAGV